MIRGDDRGVTAPLEYVFTFAIAAILITGLILAATSAAGDRKRLTVEAQMQVVAEQVAGSLENADAVVQSTEPTSGGTYEVSFRHELPDQLLGAPYTVELRHPPSGGTDVIVSSSLTGDTATAHVDLETGVSEATVGGGPITVSYDDATGDLEVTDD